MAATSARQATKQMGNGPLPLCLALPNIASTTYIKGTIGCVQRSTGRAAPGSATAGLVAVGKIKDDYVTTTADATKIEIEPGVYLWANSSTTPLTVADRLELCYVEDNETVCAGTDGNTLAPAGIVIDVTSAGVWVLMGPGVVSAAASGTIKVASRHIDTDDLSAAATSEAVAFSSALPAGAMVIGAGVVVSAVFDNAGDSADCSIDIGVSGGDGDAFVDGASLDAVATPVPVAGASMGGLVGAITPAATVISDVNVNTLTKGECVAYLAYVEVF